MDTDRLIGILNHRLQGPFRDFTITGELPLGEGLVVHTRIQQADQRGDHVPGRVRMSIVEADTGSVLGEGRAQGIWTANMPGRAHEHVRSRDVTVREALSALVENLQSPQQEPASEPANETPAEPVAEAPPDLEAESAAETAPDSITEPSPESSQE